jgi:hypothetical protein
MINADRCVAIVAGSSALALLATIAGTGNALSMIPLLWFLAVIPGLPFVRMLRNDEDPVAFWLTTIALSIAIDALAAEALLYGRGFSALAVVSVLAGIAWLGAAIGRLRSSGDAESAVPARRA